eukprot:gene19000-24818_t
MGKECEEMQIIALSEYLGFDQLDEGNKQVRTIHLLYRPGHYDILYPK